MTIVEADRRRPGGLFASIMFQQPYRPTSRVSRRAMLVASGSGFAGLSFGRPRAKAAASQVHSARAKSTILFFLCGGASHLDMWDLKPNAPDDYRGPFQPIGTTAPRVGLSY